MAGGNAGSILKRKATVGREKGPGGRRPVPTRALALAISKAFDAAFALPVSVSQCTEHICSQAELLERMPESGLFALLEGPKEAQGLMVFDPLFLGSVIEKQMTGGLAPEPPPLRRPTRTDAALTADLVDAILAAFAAEYAGRPDSCWVAGYGYASYLEEPRPLTLMLEDTVYRLFSFTVELGAGTTRQVSGLLALLAEGRGPVVPDPELPPPSSEALTPEGWQTALAASVSMGEVALHGILHQFSLSIADIAALQSGQILELPTRMIDRTRLVALDGTVVASGRLGTSGGLRALRLLRIGTDEDADNPGTGPVAPPGTALARSAPQDADAGETQGFMPALQAATGQGIATLASLPCDSGPDGNDLPQIAELADFPSMSAMGELPDLT